MFGPALRSGFSVLFAAAPALAGDYIFFSDFTSSSLPLGSIGGRSMDARPADVDGDDDLDIFVASEFGTNLLLINDGFGEFTDESAARMPQPVRDSEDVGVGDFDGNGALDVIFVSEDDQTNEFYLNDGSGVFSEASDRIPVTGTSNAVLVALVNDDEYPDIVIGNAGQNVILINAGDATFTDETGARLPANLNTTQDLEWGDVNGDGHPDIVEANENGNRLLLNDGTGVFTDATAGRLPLPPAGEETREADLGDVDGDDDLDLFLANVTFGLGYPSQNRLLLNDGTGTFVDVTSTHLPAEMQNTVDGDLVNIDLDDDVDLVTAQAFVGTYQILENDGTGVFTDVTDDRFSIAPTGNGIDVEVADFTGDGLVDIYFTGYQRNDYFFAGGFPPLSVPDGDSGAVLGAPVARPTPFRAGTSIEFTLTEAANVAVRVLDVAGRTVETLSHGERGAGTHVVTWRPKDVAPGRYFVQVGDGGRSRAAAVTLLP